MMVDIPRFTILSRSVFILKNSFLTFFGVYKEKRLSGRMSSMLTTSDEISKTWSFNSRMTWVVQPCLASSTVGLSSRDPGFNLQLMSEKHLHALLSTFPCDILFIWYSLSSSFRSNSHLAVIIIDIPIVNFYIHICKNNI